MGKVTRKNTPIFIPFKINFSEPDLAVVKELVKLLSADKTLHYDIHDEFSKLVVKEARSAIKEIEKLNAVPTPPSLPPYENNPTQLAGT